MAWYSYPNRTLCGVLQEIRNCHKTRNYSALLGLVEEAQVYANRMESALEDSRDIRQGQTELKKIRKQIKEQQKKLQDGEDE